MAIKKRWKIRKVSEVISQDVTKGIENRNLDDKKTIICGTKAFQYYQILTLTRKKEVMTVKRYLKHRTKKHRGQLKGTILRFIKLYDKVKKVTMITYKVDRYIWI